MLPFQNLLNPPSFFHFIESLYDSRIDIWIKYLTTILFVFLPVIQYRTKIELLVIGDVTTDKILIIQSWVFTFNESLINGIFFSFTYQRPLNVMILFIKSSRVLLHLLNKLYVVRLRIAKCFVNFFTILILDYGLLKKRTYQFFFIICLPTRFLFKFRRYFKNTCLLFHIC